MLSLDIFDKIFKVLSLTHPRPLRMAMANAWFACLKGLAGALQYADRETVLVLNLGSNLEPLTYQVDVSSF